MEYSAQYCHKSFISLQNPEDIFKMFFGGGKMGFYEDPVSSGKVGHDLQANLTYASTSIGEHDHPPPPPPPGDNLYLNSENKDVLSSTNGASLDYSLSPPHPQAHSANLLEHFRAVHA